MPRFFVDKQNIKENSIQIIEDDVNHIKNVLRLQQGDRLIVCDGDGMDYHCEIQNIGKDSIDLTILNRILAETEPKVKITLYQGLPKKDKMELIIQKCVELGGVEIVPVITERVIVQIKDQKKENKKLERWNKISESAAKQSKRGIIPPVRSIMTLKDAIDDSKKLEQVFIAYENENKSLKQQLEAIEAKSIGIFIGPEGGFTEKEIDLAIENHIHSVSLGKRILRTETAGMALTTAIMYAYNEM